MSEFDTTAVSEWMKAMSSTCCARFGSIDEIRFPDSPLGTNSHGGAIRVPFFPWNETRFSSPGSG